MDPQAIERVQDMVAAADRVVVLTGAGISTDSGIPDFRGPQGVWTKNPQAEKMATIQNYLADPEVRRTAWQSRLRSAAWEARPNLGHQAIVALQDRSQLTGLITQNVDGLHQLAGIRPDLVIEVHGTMHWTICWSCGDRRPMRETLTRVTAGEDEPACLVCNGILKSDTISFGQQLVPEVIERAFQVSRDCDLLLAVGSTLQVYPVAGVVPEAKAFGAQVVIINAQQTGMDDYADEVLRGSISEILPEVLSVDRA